MISGNGIRFGQTRSQARLHLGSVEAKHPRIWKQCPDLHGLAFPGARTITRFSSRSTVIVGSD